MYAFVAIPFKANHPEHYPSGSGSLKSIDQFIHINTNLIPEIFDYMEQELPCDKMINLSNSNWVDLALNNIFLRTSTKKNRILPKLGSADITLND